jgi:hypothetical protein
LLEGTEMLIRVLNIARAWGPTTLLLWLVAAGIGFAWLIGLGWLAIVIGLFFLSLLVLVAHIWGQIEIALSRGTEDGGPGG